MFPSSFNQCDFELGYTFDKSILTTIFGGEKNNKSPFLIRTFTLLKSVFIKQNGSDVCEAVEFNYKTLTIKITFFQFN